MTSSENSNSRIAGGATPPPIDESLALLGELISIWKSNLPSTLPVLDGTALRGVSLMAHVDHAVSTTEAVLTLCEHEKFIQIVPLVRLVMECAVTAAWLSVTPGSGDSALFEASRLRRAMMSDVSRLLPADSGAGLKDINDAIADLGDVQSDEAKKFETRCRSLAGGDWIYVSYRNLSEFSHAGTLLLDHYIQETPASPENPLGFNYVTDEDTTRTQSVLGTCVWMLHIALTAWDSMIPIEDRTRRLASIAQNMGFESTVRRRDEPQPEGV